MQLNINKRAQVRRFEQMVRSGYLRLEPRRCLCGSNNPEPLVRFGRYGELRVPGDRDQGFQGIVITRSRAS